MIYDISKPNEVKAYINGLVQDCSNSIANALELLQSSTKPSIYTCFSRTQFIWKFLHHKLLTLVFWFAAKYCDVIMCLHLFSDVLPVTMVPLWCMAPSVSPVPAAYTDPIPSTTVTRLLASARVYQGSWDEPVTNALKRMLSSTESACVSEMILNACWMSVMYRKVWNWCIVNPLLNQY